MYDSCRSHESQLKIPGRGSGIGIEIGIVVVVVGLVVGLVL